MVQTHPHVQQRFPKASSRTRRAGTRMPVANGLSTVGSRYPKAAGSAKGYQGADEPAWRGSPEERRLQQLRQLASVFPDSHVVQE